MCVERAFGHLKMVFRVLTASENCLKADEARLPMYILSYIVMHNFLKELGHVVDEGEAEQFQDQPGPEEARRREGLPVVEPGEELLGAGLGAADGRVVMDQLCRLWLINAQE